MISILTSCAVPGLLSMPTVYSWWAIAENTQSPSIGLLMLLKPEPGNFYPFEEPVLKNYVKMIKRHVNELYPCIQQNHQSITRWHNWSNLHRKTSITMERFLAMPKLYRSDAGGVHWVWSYLQFSGCCCQTSGVSIPRVGCFGWTNRFSVDCFHWQ